MWIFLNDAMYSIVEHWDDRDILIVRARNAGDIEEVFMNAEVIETPENDYRYRAFVDRTEVADLIAQEVMDIDYGNFKNSIATADVDRKRAYTNVWYSMFNWQNGRLY